MEYPKGVYQCPECSSGLIGTPRTNHFMQCCTCGHKGSVASFEVKTEEASPMAFDIENIAILESEPDGHALRRPKRNDAIALAKHFGLFDELEERITDLAIAGNAVVDLVDNKYALSIAISSWKELIKDLTNEQN